MLHAGGDRHDLVNADTPFVTIVAVITAIGTKDLCVFRLLFGKAFFDQRLPGNIYLYLAPAQSPGQTLGNNQTD